MLIGKIKSDTSGQYPTDRTDNPEKERDIFVGIRFVRIICIFVCLPIKQSRDAFLNRRMC